MGAPWHFRSEITMFEFVISLILAIIGGTNEKWQDLDWF